MRSDFAVFILTNRRPDVVVTYDTLRRHGYTGEIRLIVDDLDPTVEEYRARYGDEVVVFDKQDQMDRSDLGNNFGDFRSITFARNASFELSKELGFKFHMQLDDDYTAFEYRFDGNLNYKPTVAHNLDAVFTALVKFYEASGLDSLAMAQGGDFIGGASSHVAEAPGLRRKCMNSFICSHERPFCFLGLMNEDVNTYTRLGSVGTLLVTATNFSLVQKATQSQGGGITELYLDVGTYVKAFYTVMYHPSGCKVSMMISKDVRIHHAIKWNNTAPKILRESQRKAR